MPVVAHVPVVTPVMDILIGYAGGGYDKDCPVIDECVTSHRCLQ